jgi:hypothetical protein
MKKLISILFVSLLLLSGCEKYLDINQNPNDAVSSSIELVLPSILISSASRNSVDVNYDFTPWMGYWSHADGWSGWYDIKQYRLTSANQNTWWGMYSMCLMDLQYMEQNAGAPKDAYYKAIAKIQKAMRYQILVDVYGDVPYSEACKGVLAPSYDKDQTIYEDLVVQLDSAINIIKTATNANQPTTDIMFHGDMTKWEQFANTLKLRILIRQSEMSGRETYIKSHLTGLTAADFLSEDAMVNPGFTPDKSQFYYGTFGWTNTGALTSAHTQYVMNAFIEKIYDDLADPRKARCFNPAIAAAPAPEWNGKPFGLEGDGIANPYNKDKGNLIGPGLEELDVTNVKGALIISAFESYFLQAEAVQRGWIAGNAKDLYESGVKANFEYLGLTTDDVDNYLTSGKQGADWSTSTDKLNLILYQKYIAFCGINGFQAWCDYRRTGVPDPKASDSHASMLSYNDGVSRREVPSKMHYPTREFTVNNAKVMEAAKRNYGGKEPDDKYHFDSKVFWDVK